MNKESKLKTIPFVIMLGVFVLKKPQELFKNLKVPQYSDFQLLVAGIYFC